MGSKQKLDVDSRRKQFDVRCVYDVLDHDSRLANPV